MWFDGSLKVDMKAGEEEKLIFLRQVKANLKNDIFKVSSLILQVSNEILSGSKEI